MCYFCYICRPAACALDLQTASYQLKCGGCGRTAVTSHLVHDTLSAVLYLQARRVRAGLADGQSSAEMRRLWPYGSQFACDWLTRLEVARGAAAGLEYMHQHGVIHRDLTSYNLLLDFGKPWQVRV
jgi:hypothetical protein